MMNIQEIISRRDELLEDDVIVIAVPKEEWNPESPCKIINDELDDLTIIIDGKKWFYFLESSVLIEAANVWISRFGSDESNLVGALIYYGKNDALPMR